MPFLRISDAEGCKRAAVFKKHQQQKLELVVTVVPPQGNTAMITKKVTLKH
jgi:uncharacterized protein GlcG (DUF336 family)